MGEGCVSKHLKHLTKKYGKGWKYHRSTDFSKQQALRYAQKLKKDGYKPSIIPVRSFERPTRYYIYKKRRIKKRR